MSGPSRAEAQSDATGHIHSESCGHFNLAAEHIHSGGCCGTDPSLGISATLEMATDSEWDVVMTFAGDSGQASTFLPVEAASVNPGVAMDLLSSGSSTTTMASEYGPRSTTNSNGALDTPPPITSPGLGWVASEPVIATHVGGGLRSAPDDSHTQGAASSPQRHPESHAQNAPWQADSPRGVTQRVEGSAGGNRTESSLSVWGNGAQQLSVEARQQPRLTAQDASTAAPAVITTRFMGWATDRPDTGGGTITQTTHLRDFGQELSVFSTDLRGSTGELLTSVVRGPTSIASREATVGRHWTDNTQSRVVARSERPEMVAAVDGQRAPAVGAPEVAPAQGRGDSVRKAQRSESGSGLEIGPQMMGTLGSKEPVRRRSSDSLATRVETRGAATGQNSEAQGRILAGRGNSAGAGQGPVGRVPAQRDGGPIFGFEKDRTASRQRGMPPTAEKLMRRDYKNGVVPGGNVQRLERASTASGRMAGVATQSTGHVGTKVEGTLARDMVLGGALSRGRLERPVSRSSAKELVSSADINNGGKRAVRQRLERGSRREEVREVLSGRQGAREVSASRPRGIRAGGIETPVGAGVPQPNRSRVGREMNKDVTQGRYVDARAAQQRAEVRTTAVKEKASLRAGRVRENQNQQPREAARLRRDIGRVRADLLLRAQHILSISRSRSQTKVSADVAHAERALAHLLRLRLAAEILEALEGEGESLEAAMSRVSGRRSPRLRIRVRRAKKPKTHEAEQRSERSKSGKSRKVKASKARTIRIGAAKSEAPALTAATGLNSLKTGPSKSLDIFQFKAEDSPLSSQEDEQRTGQSA